MDIVSLIPIYYKKSKYITVKYFNEFLGSSP